MLNDGDARRQANSILDWISKGRAQSSR